MATKHILILGGGFGGVYTAMHLEKMLRPGEASIRLVNTENYFVYQPMLPEVISGSIAITDVVSPIRRLCPRTQLIMRQVEHIDLPQRTVTVSRGFRPRQMELPYDYLVVALGGETNFYGMPGMVEHAMPCRTLSHALALRNHVIHALEEADIENDAELRRKLLTFVVAGGGFSGVEVIAELNDFVRSVARSYQNIRPEEMRCVLVHSGDRILPEMTERLALFAEKLLRKRGVEIVLSDRLRAATSEKAILKSGTEIAAKTIVSTVPSKVPEVLDALDCSKERGRLLTNGQLEVQGFEGQVWALGDCAAANTKSGDRVPPTAQHATRAAKTVAGNIVAALRGGTPKVFDFQGLGKLAALGHHSAVADVFGIRLSGFLAWFMWRAVYLMKMPGLDRKIRVGADWFIALLLQPDLVQLKLSDPPGIAKQHFEAGEIVFNQGDLGDSVYVIRQGECEVLRETAGKWEKVAVLRDGDYFGEMAVLSDVSRNATIRVVSATEVLVISKAVFDLLKTNVPAFRDVFQSLAQQRSEQTSTRS